MKLTYRILELQFPFADTCYIAQYKLFRRWMSIGKHRNYFFYYNSNTHCESYDEAFQRIKKLQKEMNRSSWWHAKGKRQVYLEKL